MPVAVPAVKLLRPTWAEISLPKLHGNFARVKELAGERRVMAVIKADAYGHGAVPIAQALAAAGADWFGVATVEEGVELRAAGIRQPILLLGGLYMSDPADLIEYDLTPAVSSTTRLDTYAEAARRAGRSIAFHLKLDTGLGRLGLPPDRLPAFIEHYRQLEGLELAGFFTHLASAEDQVSWQSDEQVERFDSGLGLLEAAGIHPKWRHISNSAALLSRRGWKENMVRIGGALYGYCVSLITRAGRETARELRGIEPALTLKSRIVYLKDVPSRTPLGYGAAFHTRRPSRIATVPVGYADGLSRALSNRGRAIVRDHYAQIVGTVSMDLTLLDVTDIPEADVGDEVVLLGRTEHCSVSALDMAEIVGTVPYEVLCSIGRRVPRIYVD